MTKPSGIGATSMPDSVGSFHAQVPDRVSNTPVGAIEVRGRRMPFTAVAFYDREPFAFRREAKVSVVPGVTGRAEDAHNGQVGLGDQGVGLDPE